MFALLTLFVLACGGVVLVSGLALSALLFKVVVKAIFFPLFLVFAVVKVVLVVAVTAVFVVLAIPLAIVAALFVLPVLVLGSIF
jgi:hypothetical protein